MINLSTCPRCMRMVTLPDERESSASVRCPLCKAEYPLSEALALLPPALIVLPAPPEHPQSSFVVPPLGGTCSLKPAEAGTTNELCSLPAGETTDSKSPDDFALDFAEHLAEAEALPAEGEESDEVQEAALNTGEDSTVADEPSTAVASEKKMPGEKNKEPPRARPLLNPLPPRRKRKKKGPLRVLLGWVFGGGVGLLIAYYGVWWIRGESADWPRFDWLPFLPAEERVVRTPVKPDPPVIHSNPPQDEAAKKPPIKPAEKASKPQVGPRSAATFTSLDLDTAIQEALDALFDNNGTGKVNSQSYPQFCRLAEVQTYIAPDGQLPAQKKTVQEMLGNIAKDPQQFAEIGRLADEAVSKAGEHPGGILLAGKATKISSKNGLHGAFIELAGGGNTATVMSDKPLNFRVDDQLLLLGGMIAKPAENLAGYSGKSPLVIWVGDSITVAAPAP